MAWPRYQKTALGWQELQQRTLKLGPPARALLILCNGRVSRAELQAQLGAAADDLLNGLLDDLVQRGLVDVVPAAPVARRLAEPPPLPEPEPVPVPPADVVPDVEAEVEPAPGPAAATATAPEPAATAAPPVDLRAAGQRALAVTQPLYGPGGGRYTQALLQARDSASFEQALAALHDNLAVYQGRKAAAALVRRIRGNG